MSAFVPPQTRAAWIALEQLAAQGVPSIAELQKSHDRHDRFCLTAAGLTLEFDHQRVNPKILDALIELANQSHVSQKAQSMFKGEPINSTEVRPALHVALRGSHEADPPWGEAIAKAVTHEIERFCAFAQEVRSLNLKGYSQQSITDVVNLGIGGSDLGPRMACEALKDNPRFSQPVNLHFVSNVDAWSLYSTIKGLNPEKTAFIVQSKSFSTQETMLLANSAKEWLKASGCPEEKIHHHLIAVTANAKAAQSQGYLPHQTFQLWDWVGGRYSIWSSIGLPLAILIGSEGFKDFLAGGHAMDQHFLNAPAQENLPLLMALLGIWNRNFLEAPTHLIAPYVYPLAKFTSFIQQMDMESNGKHIHHDGTKASVETGPILWGGLGNDGQHAYFQLIHQGQHLIPVDFIGQRQSNCPMPGSQEHHRLVLLNLKAQRKALALGRDEAQTQKELLQSGLSAKEAQALTPHRTFPGNVPSSTLWFDELDPRTLGSLIALYEHKIFCQACIWEINAFDQWGVELGKKMALELDEIQHKA
jgi:glucose-6-phosphate isomerase